MNLNSFRTLFGSPKPVIGMVHLLPLPGCPLYQGDIGSMVMKAKADALALASGGVDALIIENFGDAPFLPGTAGPETVAAMTLAVYQIKESVQKPIGINVLRNDAMSSIAIATVLECDFVRINVHTGVVATDQGIIEGRAFETLRYRESLNSAVRIFADVFVKHGRTLHSADVVAAAQDTIYRGLADGVILTGAATGQKTDPDSLSRVKAVLPDSPVLAGSGITPEGLKNIIDFCDGVIVGTSLKIEGDIHNPVDIERVKILLKTRDLLIKT